MNSRRSSCLGLGPMPHEDLLRSDAAQRESIVRPAGCPSRTGDAAGSRIPASWLRSLSAGRGAGRLPAELRTIIRPTRRSVPQAATTARTSTVAGCRRAVRLTVSQRPRGLAFVGSPARNRPRSSASSRAERYRRAGSFSRHFKQMLQGRAGSPDGRGAAGSVHRPRPGVRCPGRWFPRCGGRPQSIE